MTMSTLAGRHTVILAVLGLVAVAALAFGSRAGTSLAQAPAAGAMAVDCDGAQAGVQSDCSYPSGSMFNVEIHVTGLPQDGYYGFQTKLRWTDGVVAYLPAADPADEALWPDCVFPARAIGEAPAIGDPIDPSVPVVTFGCAPGFPPPTAGSTFTGAVLVFEFECPAAGNGGPGNGDLSAPVAQAAVEAAPTGNLDLVSEADDPPPGAFGSHFLDALGNRVSPELTGATVNCGAPAPETPEAPTATVAVATELPESGAAGINSAGSGVGVWALLAALVAAGAGGLVLFGWRYASR